MRPVPASGSCRCNRHGVDVLRQLVAVELAAHPDGELRSHRIGDAASAALVEHALTVDVVVVGLATELLRGDFLQLVERVRGGNEVRAAHGERRIAAELADVPRQVLAAVAALDHAVLPVVFEHFGGHARGAGVRERAEVADAGVNVQHAIRRDTHQAVEAGKTRRMKRLPYRNARDLAATALAAALHALRPVEAGRADVERFLQIAARHLRLVGSVGTLVRGRVELADLEPVHLELACCAIEQRLHDDGELVVAGPALRRAQR